MPDNIPFREIPLDIITPGQFIEVDNTKALGGAIPSQDRRLLIIAQKLVGGTATVNVPVLIEGPEHGAALCGIGSMGHLMVKRAQLNNPFTETWLVAVDDNPAGAAATGSITVTGTPTESGTLRLYIGGEAVSVGITAAQTQNTIASNIAAAINGNAELEVTATVATNVVALTARHKGECGNDIDVRLNYYTGERLPAGITVAIGAMAGGSGNPDVGPVLAGIADRPFYSIACPWADAANLSTLEDELSSRWGPMQQKTGHLFASRRGSYGTLVAFGDTRNSVHVSMLDSEGHPRSPCVRAAMWAAQAERRGSQDPARPYFGIQLVGDMPPTEDKRRTREQRNNLYQHGISSTIADAGGKVIMEQVITMYRKNTFNVTDRSYMKLQTKWTVDYFRYAVRATIALEYPDYKLADDGTNFAPGQAIVTPSLIRDRLLALFKDLELVGLVEDYEQFKRDLIVVRSVANKNQVNAILPPNVVNQFDVFAAAVQFRL